MSLALPSRERMKGMLPGSPGPPPGWVDIPLATAAPPTVYSRIRAQPMSQATLQGRKTDTKMEVGSSSSSRQKGGQKGCS